MGRRDEEFEDDEEFMDDEDGQEDSLSGALAQQWGAAPWYVSSFGIHVVVFLILLIFAPPPRQKEEPPIVVQTTLAEPPEEEPEDEEDPPEIPDPQDVTEIDIVLDPQIQAEVDIEIEITEEAVEDPVEGDPSEFDTMSDDIHSPALMGIGAVGGAGGSGGKFGSRTGRGKGRALRKGAERARRMRWMRRCAGLHTTRKRMACGIARSMEVADTTMRCPVWRPLPSSPTGTPPAWGSTGKRSRRR